VLQPTGPFVRPPPPVLPPPVRITRARALRFLARNIHRSGGGETDYVNRFTKTIKKTKETRRPSCPLLPPVAAATAGGSAAMSICGYHSPRFSEVNAPPFLRPSLPGPFFPSLSLGRTVECLQFFSSRARWGPRDASVSKNFPVLSFFSPGYCLAPPMASTVWHADGWRPPEYHYRRFVAFLPGALLIFCTNWLRIC
jgi:hypothetical protein